MVGLILPFIYIVIVYNRRGDGMRKVGKVEGGGGRSGGGGGK